MFTILFIAFGLAMDAFAVSISSGFTIKNLKVENALKVAVSFGLFQAVMPVIGWLAGLGMKEYIAAFDHWAAFALLGAIGIKMIYESGKMKKENAENPLGIYRLLLLSFATSIDALAVGLTLSFLDVAIALPVIVIGFVTFVLSFSGVYIGNRVGHFFENRIEIAGGLILIAIGFKILFEHTGVI